MTGICYLNFSQAPSPPPNNMPVRNENINKRLFQQNWYTHSVKYQIGDIGNSFISQITTILKYYLIYYHFKIILRKFALQFLWYMNQVQ